MRLVTINMTMAIIRALIYTALLAIIFPSTFNNSLIWSGIFFVAIILRDIFFSLQKYLSRLTVLQDNKISTEYIDSLFRTKNFEITLDDNMHLDLSEMKSRVDYPASLTFIDSDNMAAVY